MKNNFSVLLFLLVSHISFSQSLPLSGGTLSGPLVGTSATFGNTVDASSSMVGGIITSYKMGNWDYAGYDSSNNILIGALRPLQFGNTHFYAGASKILEVSPSGLTVSGQAQIQHAVDAFGSLSGGIYTSYKMGNFDYAGFDASNNILIGGFRPSQFLNTHIYAGASKIMEVTGGGVDVTGAGAFSGSVRIGGAADPNSRLTVAGRIHSQEVKVTVTAGADFVFDEDYNLPALFEIEKFIKQNKHLPDIAPAKDMVKNGIDLGETNIKLLQKIEELTLYVIELNKENKEQGANIKDLVAEIQKLKSKP